jgi:hypothetical protein
LTPSTSVLKAPLLSTLETIIAHAAFNVCFQFQLAPLLYGNRYTDMRADICGGGECRTQEQAFKLATHWKERGHLQGGAVQVTGIETRVESAAWCLQSALETQE